jgi:hypothetical protein
MKLTRTATIKGEGAIGLLVIVLLLLGGIVWWLYSARGDAARDARHFAGEMVQSLAVKYDGGPLRVHLSPEAQNQYIKSWQDRLVDHLRELGVPEQPIALTGDVTFTSYFFDPRGMFRAELKYPTTSAQLELGISRGMTMWQVDMINLTWNPPPAPTPSPTPVAVPSPTPTPTPTPEPEQKQKRRRKR